MLEDIYIGLDQHCDSLFVSLDISKAFGRVWHKGLLFKAYIKCNHCYLRGSWQKLTFLVKKGLKTYYFDKCYSDSLLWHVVKHFHI